MNFHLDQIPGRTAKPRQNGITMVMDKGLSIEEAKHFMSVSHPYVDLVKFGFGTAFVTPNLREKLELYRSYDLPIYFGGTLFEAFLIRQRGRPPRNHRRQGDVVPVDHDDADRLRHRRRRAQLPALPRGRRSAGQLPGSDGDLLLQPPGRGHL